MRDGTEAILLTHTEQSNDGDANGTRRTFPPAPSLGIGGPLIGCQSGEGLGELQQNTDLK